MPTHAANTMNLETSQLIDQLGKYSATNRTENLNHAGVTALFANTASPSPANHTDPMYHRKKFIEHVMRLKSMREQSEIAPTHDQKPIKLESLLGSDGATLYKQALKEERESKEFMDAVLSNSWKHYDGPELAKRAVVVMSGPSASGKSYASDKIMQDAVNWLPHMPGGKQTGYDVVAIDGGVVRETSQIRKLAIQFSLQQGHVGIADLHDQSKSILDPVKQDIQRAAEKTDGLNMVIPETFSTVVREAGAEDFFDPIHKLTGTQVVFCRIDCANPENSEAANNFQNVVRFMGNSRAWGTQQSANTGPFDLNRTGLPESKEYGGFGFHFGVRGSKKAEGYFKTNDNGLSINLMHDLILLKPDPQNPGQWQIATEDGPGVILVSNEIFARWKQASASKRTELTLPEFNKAVRATHTPRMVFSGKYAIEQAIKKCLSTQSFASLNTLNESEHNQVLQKVSAQFPTGGQGILSWIKPENSLANILNSIPNKEDVQSVLDLTQPQRLWVYLIGPDSNNSANLANLYFSLSPEKSDMVMPIIMDRLGASQLSLDANNSITAAFNKELANTKVWNKDSQNRIMNILLISFSNAPLRERIDFMQQMANNNKDSVHSMLASFTGMISKADKNYSAILPLFFSTPPLSEDLLNKDSELYTKVKEIKFALSSDEELIKQLANTKDSSLLQIIEQKSPQRLTALNRLNNDDLNKIISQNPDLIVHLSNDKIATMIQMLPQYLQPFTAALQASDRTKNNLINITLAIPVTDDFDTRRRFFNSYSNSLSTKDQMNGALQLGRFDIINQLIEKDTKNISLIADKVPELRYLLIKDIPEISRTTKQVIYIHLKEHQPEIFKSIMDRHQSKFTQFEAKESSSEKEQLDTNGYRSRMAGLRASKPENNLENDAAKKDEHTPVSENRLGL